MTPPLSNNPEIFKKWSKSVTFEKLSDNLKAKFLVPTFFFVFLISGNSICLEKKLISSFLPLNLPLFCRNTFYTFAPLGLPSNLAPS